jgi:membrane-bound lytic murein transglycosylase D
MRRLAQVALAIALLASLARGGEVRADVAPGAPAAASAGAVHAGAQAVPPVRADDPTLPEQADGRRAIRGCAVDERCVRPADALRAFELEAFPPPGQDPWIDERATPGSHLEAAPPRKVARPSELRPDLAWLDQLELPDLPVVWTPRLIDYLVFYKDDPRGRAIMADWLVAQGRYRDLMVGYLRRAHLPADLLYVAMIESSYDPGDSSSAGALGVWQFMPENGRIYGLRQDRWVDERRDPLRSTIAMMDYWQDLYQRFGDWHVAMAAFNAGYGAMLRSIARYNTNDYWQICQYENGLPWETTLYVPKALAAAIVGHNRALFGFDKLKEKPAEVWDEVAVPTSLPVAIIARAAGTSAEDIVRLNPHLRHGRTPPGEAGYVVRVPAGAGGKAEFARRLVELQSDWDGYDAYVVAHGERFEDVATTFGISTAALRKLNDVAHESEVEGGAVLVVPRITEAQREANRTKAKAKLLGSGVDQKDGEALIVPVPDKDAQIDGKRRVFYRVVTGDTLRGIAKALGVGRDQLASWNGLEAAANLHPKMVLQAWVAPAFDAKRAHVALLDDTTLLVVTRGSPEHLDLAEQRTGRVRVEYTAAGKESLQDVGRRYGLSQFDLARINRISHRTVLEKGQTIIVYQVVEHGRSKRADEQWAKTPRARRGKPGGPHAQRVAGSPSGATPTTTTTPTAPATTAGDGAADEGPADADGDAPDDEANAPAAAAAPVTAPVTPSVTAPVTPPVTAPTAATSKPAATGKPSHGAPKPRRVEGPVTSPEQP